MAAGPVPILGVPRRKDQKTGTPETAHGPNGRYYGNRDEEKVPLRDGQKSK